MLLGNSTQQAVADGAYTAKARCNVRIMWDSRIKLIATPLAVLCALAVACSGGGGSGTGVNANPFGLAGVGGVGSFTLQWTQPSQTNGGAPVTVEGNNIYISVSPSVAFGTFAIACIDSDDLVVVAGNPKSGGTVELLVNDTNVPGLPALTGGTSYDVVVTAATDAACATNESGFSNQITVTAL